MSIVAIIVVLALVGLLLWAVTQIPMDPAIANIIRVVAIVAVVIWLITKLVPGALAL